MPRLARSNPLPTASKPTDIASVSLLLYVDQYIPAFHKDWELRHLHLPVETMHAGAAIVSAPVPWANQQTALQNTLAERPAATGTDPVEGMNFAVQIAKRVFVPTCRDLGRRARWE